MGGNKAAVPPVLFCDVIQIATRRDPTTVPSGFAGVEPMGRVWGELVRRPDVQNKAHRIVLGQEGYCQDILRTSKLRLSLRDSACSKMDATAGQFRVV